jgi:2,4-dienoyl-CoA reductase-like NADH-dependent reductase (Old Yellow Enzyme family)
MTRDPRYDILFDPVRIGPVVAKNRFFQVPHCNGMGIVFPSSMIAMRAMKAEGGWAVVCTEETDIHPTGDLTPLVEGRLWDDRDIPVFARMNEAVHAHGALAGVELAHTANRDPCLYSREVPLNVGHAPAGENWYPAQARAMDLADIRAYRRWHREAAIRAMRAGFDIVYVYCRAHTSMNGNFLSRAHNDRGDEYGGSLENRARLLREVLADTKDAVGGRCAVAIRYTVDDQVDPDGEIDLAEGRAVVEMLAEIPDLWDVNIRQWSHDSITSRFGPSSIRSQASPSSASAASPHPTRWSRRSVAVFSISLARRAPRSPIPSCRGRSRKGVSTTSASASVATCVSLPISPSFPCVAPRTRPPARSGARAGTRNASRRGDRTTMCWSSGRDRLDLNAQEPLANAAMP